ncbi:hypothetical protein [Lutibacter sp.]|uniref:hypothetical protein n=1 Tax=Lutibacter sp. TaxID=1925666 RepID=UPI0038CD9C7B
MDIIIIDFNPSTDIIFNREFLPFHSNGIKFIGLNKTTKIYNTFPFPIQKVKNMNSKYKEILEGDFAVSINIADC